MQEQAEPQVSRAVIRETWTGIEVLAVCTTKLGSKEICLIKASPDEAKLNAQYVGEDRRLERQDYNHMWGYPTVRMRGGADRKRHSKTAVLDRAGAVLENHTHLKATLAKAKKLLAQKDVERWEASEYLYTALYTYECSEEEMEDNRWGLRGEDGIAGNIIAGTVDAVWVPLDIAYGLTEASPDVIMPESFRTSMVASYLAGERGATQRMLDTVTTP